MIHPGIHPGVVIDPEAIRSETTITIPAGNHHQGTITEDHHQETITEAQAQVREDIVRTVQMRIEDSSPTTIKSVIMRIGAIRIVPMRAEVISQMTGTNLQQGIHVK